MKHTHIWVFIVTLFFASCGGASDSMNENYTESAVYSKREYAEQATFASEELSEDAMVKTNENVNSPENEQLETNNTPVSKKKIIKDGNMSIEVDDIKRSKTFIDSLVKANQAYYALEDLQNNDYSTTYNLTIRIPAQNFETFVAGVESGQGKIEGKSINARDVTEQFYDLQSRLNSKKAYLARYTELLKKANSIRDILEIEEKIRAIQEEIESVEGKLKLLSDLVSFSTLNLVVTYKKDYKYEPTKRKGFFEKLKQSMSNGWYALQDFIVAVLGAWPFWIILAGIIWLVRKWIISRRERKNKA